MKKVIIAVAAMVSVAGCGTQPTPESSTASLKPLSSPSPTYQTTNDGNHVPAPNAGEQFRVDANQLAMEGNMPFFDKNTLDYLEAVASGMCGLMREGRVSNREILEYGRDRINDIKTREKFHKDHHTQKVVHVVLRSGTKNLCLEQEARIDQIMTVNTSDWEPR